MRLETPPELHDGISSEPRKQLAAIQQEIKVLIAAEAARETAVQELRQADGFPEHGARHRLEEQRYELLQRRLQLCESAMALADDVVDDLQKRQTGLPPRRDAEDAVAQKLESAGYKVEHSSRSGWTARAAGVSNNVNGLVLSHQLVAEYDSTVREIARVIRDWQDYKFAAITEKPKVEKHIDRIREEALAAV